MKITCALYILFLLLPLAWGHNEKRSFEGRRRLHLRPYGPSPNAPSTMPTLAYKGGPPDAVGIWQSDSYIGIIQPAGFASTLVLPDGTYQAQIGRYTSWECTVMPNVYMATVQRADIYNNGTIVYNERCEIGKIDIEQGLYFWKSSTTGCPDPATAQWDMPNYRVTSVKIPGPTAITCTGVKGSGFENEGTAGLVTAKRTGVTSGSPLPPALKPSPFPPVFSQSGTPADVIGIWYGDETQIGELVSKEGFSSVQLLPDTTFMQVLGRFNSYNCTGSGAYTGSISYSIIYQNMTIASAAGCTSGTVNLQDNKYKWAAGSDAACPDFNSMNYELKRANTSQT